MKNRYITFSIITPAYNSAKYIQKCIDSVCNVDYNLSRVEHIIIDDGSTDNTQDIVKRNMRKFPHIKYYYKKNGNWGSVINYAKHNKLAKNKYVLILDSDDRITPQAFKLVNKKSKNCDIFYGSFIMTDFKKKNFPVQPYYYVFRRSVNLTRKTKIIHSPLSIPCNTYFKTNLFYKCEDLKEKVSYQDGIFYANLSHLAKTARYTSQCVALYWKYRPDNTMSQFKQDSTFKSLLPKFEYLLENGNFEPAVLQIIGCREFQTFLKKSDYKFHIKDKAKFEWLPFYTRPFLWMLYGFYINKYFVNDKKVLKKYSKIANTKRKQIERKNKKNVSKKTKTIKKIKYGRI